MAKNSNKGKVKGGKKTNPMLRRVPRTPNMRANFDGTNIHYRQVATTLGVVSPNKIYSATYPITPTAVSLVDIAEHYSDYICQKMSVEYIPYIGPAHADSGSRVYMAYIDNMEKFRLYLSYGLTSKLAVIKTMSNVVVHNAWERFTYNVPLTARRKSFAVDNSLTDDLNTYERGVQGGFITILETITGNTIDAGGLMITSDFRLTGLIGTGLLTT